MEYTPFSINSKVLLAMPIDKYRKFVDELYEVYSCKNYMKNTHGIIMNIDDISFSYNMSFKTLTDVLQIKNSLHKITKKKVYEIFKNNAHYKKIHILFRMSKAKLNYCLKYKFGLTIDNIRSQPEKVKMVDEYQNNIAQYDDFLDFADFINMREIYD